MHKIIRPCGLHCIKIEHLSVVLNHQEILKDINLHIHCGTLNVVIGRNGAGKSTLIKALLNEVPHEGEISFKDQEEGNIQSLKIGYVPQSLNLDPNSPISVYDMIAGFRSNVPVFLVKSKRIYQEIASALQVFEAAHLIDKQVSALSGGELQRVLLAMAIMDEPNLLLLDEPVSGIDKTGIDLFYHTIYQLKKEYDLAIILISHDLDYVAQYADHVILLDQAILEQGKVKEVYDSNAFRQIFHGAFKEERQ